MQSYRIVRDGRDCQIVLLGDLTAAIVGDLQTDLKKEMDAGVQNMVFDLDNTVMLDSSGIGLLIAACNSLSRSGGTVRVCNVSDDLLNLLQSMRLVQRLHVTGRGQKE